MTSRGSTLGRRVAEGLRELDGRAATGDGAGRAALAAGLMEERRSSPAAFDRAVAAALEVGGDRARSHGPGSRWRNYLGDFDVPVADADWWRPTTVKQLAAKLGRAVAAGRRVRCVGSGHSSSDVAVPGEVLVEIGALSRLQVEPTWHRPGGPGAPRLVYAEAGLTIRELTRRLWDSGLALPNMGSYNGQTLAGAVSTGTHGSGLHTGPLPDLVHALDLLTVEADGVPTVLRLERDHGPTDPAKFASFAGRFGCPARLEKDTRGFEAALVSLGSLGIVVGLTLEVVERFWMAEVRAVTTWRELRPRLRTWVEQCRVDRIHPEVSILPNPLDGEVRCLTLERRPHPPRPGRPPARKLEGQWLLDLASWIGTRPLGWFATLFPELLAKRVLESFEASAAAGPFVSSAPEVFVLGYGKTLDITSSEAHVPLDLGVLAIDRLVATAAEEARHHRHHTAPVGVRFTGASRSALAMAAGRETCTLEVPFPLGVVGWRGQLERLEDELVRTCDARMHWGQVNGTTAGRAAAAYPRWPEFLAAYRRFGAHGTWRSPFTDRLGL